jgi:NAD(P)-dependent dehydrogenase (short-subunit alcohol dehydrogenase family)
MTTNDKSKTAVVTGATSGLGEAAAMALAKAGYRVFAVGRDPARGADLVARGKATSGEVVFLPADLFSLADVRRLGREIRSRAPALDLLVNNAGGTFGKKDLTTDGLERTFALNVAAPFVLTEELVGPLAAAGGRVVNLVTGVQKGARTTLDKLVGEKASGGMGAYIQNKLALLALTQEQQRRYGDRGITVVALHPGVIPDTRFGQDMPAFLRKVMGFVARLFRFASTLDEAAARYVAVGTGPVEKAGFYYEGVLRPAPLQAQDREFAAALWARVAEVTSRPALPQSVSAQPAMA